MDCRTFDVSVTDKHAEGPGNGTAFRRLNQKGENEMRKNPESCRRKQCLLVLTVFLFVFGLPVF